MGGPRDPRFTPRTRTSAGHAPNRAARRAAHQVASPVPAPTPRPVRARPNPNPMRLMLGFAGLASLTALTAAMVPSVAPTADAAVDPAITVAEAPVSQDAAPVRHVTQYVTLAPGQTPPPGGTVQAQPKPTPTVKVKIVTRSRQSGQP
jgi:hypothetical protein